MLDLVDVMLFSDRPDSYLLSEFYMPFNYLLPESFIQNTTIMIQDYTVWYDEFNIKGVSFTFTNGSETNTTGVFGVTQIKGVAK